MPRLIIFLSLLMPIVVVACFEVTEPATNPLRLVGAADCIRCHPQEGRKWRGSDHDRAMEIATEDSVEGHFDGSTLRHAEQLWRFQRTDHSGDVETTSQGEEGYVIELEIPDQPIERFVVAYTFGFDPIQQYLVTRPDGRMQALPVAWDVRSSEEGGQRWIDLQVDGEVAPGDPTHWDGLAYNWNSQCASCHSTLFKKGYDPDGNRFESSWGEIDVACEACHGLGSRHVELVRAPGFEGKEASGFDVRLEPWDPDAWRREPNESIAKRVIRREVDSEIDICAPCHSRRSQLIESPGIGEPFLDGYRPAMLDGELYFEDGQIRDEVYVWGSFLQSRMYASGVRCSDCHDPHSLDLRRPGSSLCLGCHDSVEYAGPSHHGHEVGSPGSECVDCHMPERVYMKVDGRRDHSFRVPNPERSEKLKAPSVCQGCHSDRDALWLAKQISKWHPNEDRKTRHWSDHLVDEAGSRADAERWVEIAENPGLSSIARASAWSRLSRELRRPRSLASSQDQRVKASDLERLALIEVVRSVTPEERVLRLAPLLDDPFRAIRITAAEALAEMPESMWPGGEGQRSLGALGELRAVQDANAERPEAQVGRGLLFVREGDDESARRAYLRALELAPYFLPAYANLADLERSLGRDAEAVIWLRKALAVESEAAFIRYALGLALHRAGDSEEALAEFARAAQLAPAEPRLVLGWALALDAAGQRSQAVAVLEGAIDRGIRAGTLYHALVTLLRDSGRRAEARGRAEAWLDFSPDDARAGALIRELGGGV